MHSGGEWPPPRAWRHGQSDPLPFPPPPAAAVSLPQGLHDVTLPGKLLLQVDEVANIGAAVRERYNGIDGASRCLKLLLTDGGCCALGAACRPPNATGATHGGTACLPAGIPTQTFLP